jgi:hypothetical protein
MKQAALTKPVDLQRIISFFIMNRKTAHEILDNENSARTRHVRNFIGSHSHTVAEALVIWSQLEDCPPCLRGRLDSLRSELKHLPEFSESNSFSPNHQKKL